MSSGDRSVARASHLEHQRVPQIISRVHGQNKPVHYLFKFAATLMFENPARNKSFAELRQKLEVSSAEILERCAKMSDSANNRKVLTHIIAIERWGANRLAVLLRDKPLELDSSRAYAPDSANWAELQEIFKQTRAATVNLTARLAASNSVATVAHNQFGEVSGRGWVQYLTSHAHLESRKIRG